MNENGFYKKLAFAALGLWILTIGVLGYFFIKGYTQKSTDNRQEVMLSPSERDLVLGEMRQLLDSVNGILNGLVENDLVKVEKSARAGGMQMAQDVNPMLMGKLPSAFKGMGMGVHKALDDLADALKQNKDPQDVMKRVAKITQTCVACHAVYRLSSDK